DEHLSITSMPRSRLLAGLARALPGRAQPAIAPGLLDYAGTALAGLIGSARQQAIADGVRAVPPGVYRSLLGYFPATLLRRARFAVGGAGRLRVPTLAISYGDGPAMTLGDVIRFKTEQTADADLKVW